MHLYSEAVKRDNNHDLVQRDSGDALLADARPPVQPKTVTRQYYDLDTAKMREFWHNAVVRGVIKAHSKQLVRQLPYVEAVVFDLCARGASTTVELAKCAVRVFDARDHERSRLRANQARVESRMHRLRNGYLYRTNSSVVTKGVHISAFYYQKPQRRRLHRLRRPPRRLVRSLSRRRKEERNSVPQRRRRRLTGIFSRRTLKRRPRSPDKWLRDSVPENLGPIESQAHGSTNFQPIDSSPSSRPAPDIRNIMSKYLRKILLGSRVVSHVDNLRIIRDHFRRVEKCNKFFTHMNEHNRRFAIMFFIYTSANMK
ncbi:hypothetical protein Q1695_011739 [Nippostrongylus brasiliensis]|nr:hypothetical protein Q1695_011739 [Nippostrongylus brasiliensis]